MAEAHPRLKTQDLQFDRHSSVPIRCDSDPGLALRVVDHWVSDCLQLVMENRGGDPGRHHYRLFYHDRIFGELMFRLIVRHQSDGRTSRELVLARVVVRSSQRDKGYFRDLLQGLQQLATQLDASLVIESANSKLSRILFGLGYLRCEDDTGSARIRTKLSGSWKYNPERASAMALIELPSEVLTIAGRGRGLSAEVHERMNALLEGEVVRFLSHLTKRFNAELGPSAEKA